MINSGLPQIDNVLFALIVRAGNDHRAGWQLRRCVDTRCANCSLRLAFHTKNSSTNVCIVSLGKGKGSGCALVKASLLAVGFQNAGLGVLNKPARFGLS